MVRFAMQAFGNASPHQRLAKRSRSEALVELPSSPPLPPQLQEDEHQLSATFDPDTLDCNICMESLAAPIFQVLFFTCPKFKSCFRLKLCYLMFSRSSHPRVNLDEEKQIPEQPSV